MFSKTAIHALTALAALAELPEGQFAGASELAARVGAPPNYLGKLLKMLAERGLLLSQKGRGGGFRLARPAEAISLLDVMEPVDHVNRWAGCFLGRKRCASHAPCAVHGQWGKVRDSYFDFLRQTSLAELAK